MPGPVPVPLPLIDEHTRVVAAPPDTAWHGLVSVVTGALDRSLGPLARAWGMRPTGPGGPRPLTVGSTGAGFRVVTADEDEGLVLEGTHRFARYRLELAVAPAGDGALVSARTLAAFRGGRGRIYRLLVIGSGGHAVAMGRLLRSIERAAGRASRH